MVTFGAASSKAAAADADEREAIKGIAAERRRIADYGTVEGRRVHSVAAVPAICWYILVVELCERLSFYTIAGSQEFFLEHVGIPLGRAGGLNATMGTLCSVLTIFASWTADVGLGRYWTILAAGSLYIVATAVTAMGAIPGHQSAGFYVTGVMGLLPLATAGIKANIANFGADQYDDTDPAQKLAQEHFFSIFYGAINIGAALSFGFFTTFASNGGLGVPRDWGYAAAYGAMSGCMLLAVAVFRIGRHQYFVVPLQRQSAVASLLGAVGAAARAGTGQAVAVCAGLGLLLASILLSVGKALAPEVGKVSMSAAFVCAALGTFLVVLPCRCPSWLTSVPGDSRQEVEDVRKFMSLIPMLFTGNFAFNSLYNSMSIWYQQQACQMDVRFYLFSTQFELSGSFFNIADCLAIIVATPLVVAFVDPALDVAYKGLTWHARRFGIGMLIAMTSVLLAGLLEIRRRDAPLLDLASTCAPEGVRMSAMPAAWISVPYFLMGIAEIFTQPTLLHLAYSRSPPSMRTLAFAASSFIAAVSSAIFSLLLAVMEKFFPDDLNSGHLEYGYGASILMGLLFLIFFQSVLRE